MTAPKPAIFAFDTETSGLEAGFNEIISLAGILYDTRFQEIARISIHAQPDHAERFHARAKEINGYSEEEWERRGAVSQEDMASQLNAWLIKHYCYRVIPMGHNVSFDLNHLEALYHTWDMADAYDKLFSYHSLDTVGIAMFFDITKFGQLSKRYNLTELCNRYEVELNNAHDAMADIEATVKVFKKLVKANNGDISKLGSFSPGAKRKSRLLVKSKDTGGWVFNHGKHKDCTLETIAAEHAGYLNWMLDKVGELSDEQRAAIETALEHT